jgi:hypothetical protein
MIKLARTALCAAVVFLFVPAVAAKAQIPQASWDSVQTACVRGGLNSPYMTLLPRGATHLDPRALDKRLVLSIMNERYADAIDTLASELARTSFEATSASQISNSLGTALTMMAVRMRKGEDYQINELRPRPSRVASNVLVAPETELTPAIPLGESVALCSVATEAYRVLWLSSLENQRKVADSIRQAKAQYDNLEKFGYSSLFHEQLINGCAVASVVHRIGLGKVWPRSKCSDANLFPDRVQIVFMHPTAGSLVALRDGSSKVFEPVVVTDLVGFMRYSAGFTRVQLGLTLAAAHNEEGTPSPAVMLTAYGVRAGVAQGPPGARGRARLLVNLDLVGVSGRGKGIFTRERQAKVGGWIRKQSPKP